MNLIKLKQVVCGKCIKMAQFSKEKLHSFLKDERGDTNFISIIVILAIVLLLAGTFMFFRDQIIDQATAIIESFQIS